MCSGKERQVNRAEVTCYDNRCTAIQGGQPIRMCRDCHSKQHSTDTGDSSHIYQGQPCVCVCLCVYMVSGECYFKLISCCCVCVCPVGPPNPWTSSDIDSSSTMLEAVAKSVTPRLPNPQPQTPHSAISLSSDYYNFRRLFTRRRRPRQPAVARRLTRWLRGSRRSRRCPTS